MKILKKKKNTQRAFTLVEVMVSVAIFSIIMVIGIGSLVSVTNAYNVSQERKIVNDNLNFLMEGFTREIRVGKNYHSGAVDDSFAGSVKNGPNKSIGFYAVEDRGYFVYYLYNDEVYRRRFVGGDVFTEKLTDRSQILVKELEFNVVGVNDPVVDTKQPFVWIFIQGEAPNAEHERMISVQSMVSQRGLDVI